MRGGLSRGGTLQQVNQEQLRGKEVGTEAPGDSRFWLEGLSRFGPPATPGAPGICQTTSTGNVVIRGIVLSAPKW